MTQVENFERVIFVGDSNVGKTSIITYLSKGIFDGKADPTLGASIIKLTIETDENPITLQLWDTAGQEQFRSLVPLYFKNASTAVVVFSLDNIESFHNIEHWIQQIKSYAKADIPILIVGNKLDIIQDESTFETATCWCESNNYPIVYVSAKTGENIEILKSSLVKFTDTIVKNMKSCIDEPVTTKKSKCC